MMKNIDFNFVFIWDYLELNTYKVIPWHLIPYLAKEYV